LTFFPGLPMSPSIPNIDSLCISNLTGSVLFPLSCPWELNVCAWTALLSANKGLSYRLSSSLSELPASSPAALSKSLWSSKSYWFVGWAWPKATFSLMSLSYFLICFFLSAPTFFILFSLYNYLSLWYLNSYLSLKSSSYDSETSSFYWIFFISSLASWAALRIFSSFLMYSLYWILFWTFALSSISIFACRYATYKESIMSAKDSLIVLCWRDLPSALILIWIGIV